MLVLLSPSKNLRPQPPAAHRYTLPRMPDESQQLIEVLRKLKPKVLSNLMGINDKLAQLNVSRYQLFSWPHTEANAHAAIYSFSGDVYLGFDAPTLTKAQAEQADKTIRILSGLYGVLRPLDLMQPYRLEMGTDLKVGRQKNLYAFWGNKITQLLREDIAATKSKAVVNLASQEYVNAVQVDALGVPVVDIQFLEERNGNLQFLSYNAKRSRGWMARWIVDQKIKKRNDLRAFDLEGYSWAEALSGEDKLVFVR